MCPEFAALGIAFLSLTGFQVSGSDYIDSELFDIIFMTVTHGYGFVRYTMRTRSASADARLRVRKLEAKRKHGTSYSLISSNSGLSIPNMLHRAFVPTPKHMLIRSICPTGWFFMIECDSGKPV